MAKSIYKQKYEEMKIKYDEVLEENRKLGDTIRDMKVDNQGLELQLLAARSVIAELEGKIPNKTRPKVLNPKK